MPSEDPEAFNRFIDYCRQDVEVERSLHSILPALNDIESKVFELDFQINNRGVPIDMPLIKKGIAFVEEYSHRIEQEARSICGLGTNQRDKLLEWLQDQGLGMETIQAAEVERALRDPATKPEVRRVLEARIELSRAGAKKLKTMEELASPDNRLRGQFFYHAAATGRWGSNGVQLHNLGKPDKHYPQTEILDLLEDGTLDLFFQRPVTAISKAIRGFIRAPEERQLLVADYSAIEARALAWAANEEWLVQSFREGKDAYKGMASKIYNTSVDSITEDQRFFGKQVILGAGYCMGHDKFVEQCARFGIKITSDFAKNVISTYRLSVPNIVRFWSAIEAAAIKCVVEQKPISFGKGKFTWKLNDYGRIRVLCLELPSGRSIAYPEPAVTQMEKWGRVRPVLTFRTLYRGMWVEEETYGGKLTENAIQALCRDLLAEGMLFVEKGGLECILHVHDEIGTEIEQGGYAVPDFERLVCTTRRWAAGLPMKAEGKLLKRYGK